MNGFIRHLVIEHPMKLRRRIIPSPPLKCVLLLRGHYEGVQLFISDKCIGLVEAAGEFYPDARWQRCVVHFYRNVFSVVPKGKVKEVVVMLKAIHAQEDRREAEKKAADVVAKLHAMKLSK